MEKTIYQKIAGVFYAVGMADDQFVRKEKLKVIELIENYWHEQGIEVESIMHQQLKKLVDSGISSAEALNDFEAFIQEKPALFTKEIRLQLYEDAQEIALAYAGRNKSETIILSQLKHILQKDN